MSLEWFFNLDGRVQLIVGAIVFVAFMYMWWKMVDNINPFDKK